jgi:hypothetical protein
VTITPDMLAAGYTGEETEPQNELESLAELAAEYGYRLVPVDSPESAIAIVPPANSETPEDMVRRLTWLQSAVKAGEAAVKAYKAEYKQVDKALQEEWALVGRTSDTIDGFNAFFHPTASYERNDGVETADLIEALRASGLGHLVGETFNYMSLLALLKEMVEKKIGIPEKLAELITFKQGHMIKIAPAGKKRAGGRKVG